jgi:hypothetical protein
MKLKAIWRFFNARDHGCAKPDGRAGESGMLLADVAIFIVVAGLLVTGFLSGLKPITRETNEDDTRLKMERVFASIATFAQKYKYIPCPANPKRGTGIPNEPFGSERGSGTQVDGGGEGVCPNNLEGIVPFRTLGISESSVRDGFGNFLTYRITSALTPPTLPINPLTWIQEQCTIKNVWVDPGGGGAGHGNANCYPLEAYLCCPAPEANFDVTNSAGVSYINGNSTIVCTAHGAHPCQQHIDSPTPVPSLKSNGVPDVMAIVLVSFGRNGFGAFLDNGTKQFSANAASYSADEQQNASDHSISRSGLFIMAPRRESSSNYFDDIVMWRTQKQLYSELGGSFNSCSSTNRHCP